MKCLPTGGGEKWLCDYENNININIEIIFFEQEVLDKTRSLEWSSLAKEYYAISIHLLLLANI